MGDEQNRGVYVTRKEGEKVWGFMAYVRGNGRTITRKFTNCTMAFVMGDAERLIHEPKVFMVQEMVETSGGEG
tara:strand:- start:263 stop:481 length:219 start_codon:yes stop_codon:yes gene_type:complete